MKIRLLRHMAGLTQRQLAERTGLTQSAISRIERGSSISVRRMKDIARALGVHPAELLDDEGGRAKP